MYLAIKIKEEFYGNRIVMFAPLYLANYCVNGCTYCPYHYKNKHIRRKKLTQEEIKKEVIALQDMGHKRLALETGEDPVNIPIEYVLESIKQFTVSNTKRCDPSCKRKYRCYNSWNYKKLKMLVSEHIFYSRKPTTKTIMKFFIQQDQTWLCLPYRSYDRAMTAGIDDVGIGVLFGLDMYRYDFAGLLMHAEHLEANSVLDLIRSVFQESVLLTISILTISKMQSMMISLRRSLQSFVFLFLIQESSYLLVRHKNQENVS